MKKYPFILFCFITCNIFIVNAQDYQPLITENKIWHVAKLSSHAEIPARDIYKFYISGDTSINDKIYKKLFSTSYNQASPQNINTNVYAFIREDISEQKIYKIEPGTNKEKLVFDCSKQVGETMIFTKMTCSTESESTPVIVSDIETISLSNNKQVRKFHLIRPENENCYHPEYFIESIGSYMGVSDEPLNFPLAAVESEYYCVKENNSIIYGTKCHLIASASFTLQEINASVTYLTGNHVRITWPNKKFEVTLSNISSQNIFNASALNFLDINLENYPSGIYLITIKDRILQIQGSELIRKF
ncbi:MAG: hypothetical protein ACK40G_03710 [Cytophagaceae bacterium]